jgi:hypothetical protein
MMIANEPISSSPSLPAALAARARAASDGRLALDVLVGLVAAICLAVWRPMAWPIGLGIGVALASFGTWGIAERESQERAHNAQAAVRVFRLLQVTSIIVGTLAVLTAGFALVGMALGTIIS